MLFQLPNFPIGIKATAIDPSEYSIIMFLSYRFSTAKMKYHVTEREALAGFLYMEETS